MNKNMFPWLLAAALAAVPALNAAAQEGPGPGNDEMEMQEGPGQPEMGPGMGPGMGMGGRQVMVKTRKVVRGPGMGMGGPGGLLTDEEALAIINKRDPAFGKKMEDLRKVAPAKYKMLMQLAGRQLGMASMEQDEAAEKNAVRGLALEFDSKELSLKYDKAADADKKAIKESLRADLSELFDLKTRAQEMRLAHMEKEMGRLKKNLESRKANKAKIVDQRLDQMTGEGYGW